MPTLSLTLISVARLQADAVAGVAGQFIGSARLSSVGGTGEGEGGGGDDRVDMTPNT